jgi:hypothetical protein
MGPGEHRRSRLAALVLATLLVAVPATTAAGDHECYFDPGIGLVCEDHGGSGGGGGSSTSYWTSWQLVAACGGGGVIGGGLIDLTSGQVLALRDHIVDGAVVETQTECIDLDGSETLIWETVATAVRALPDPGWESDPDGLTSPGLTGLETWLWYSNPSQVGPIEAVWVEPVTGIEFGVRGRGWTESITWNTGEATYEAFAPTWDEAPFIGGSPEMPAASHLYNTSSSAAGHEAGYPVGLDLLWVGEYQVTVIGGVWTDWARFTSTLGESASDTYQVVEVRSVLSG